MLMCQRTKITLDVFFKRVIPCHIFFCIHYSIQHDVSYLVGIQKVSVNLWTLRGNIDGAICILQCI